MKAKGKPKAELFSLNRLALLAAVDRRFVERRLAAVTPSKIEGAARFYSLAAALPSLCREPENAEVEKSILQSRDRESKARAKSAEVQAALDAGEVSLLGDASNFWRDGLVRMMQVVQGAAYISAPARQRLVKEMRSIELSELDGE